MDVADSLLALARELSRLDLQGRPRQSALRGAVSTAYYACFHLIARGAVRAVLSGDDWRRFGGQAARSFTHDAVQKALQGAHRTRPRERQGFLLAAMGDVDPVPSELSKVAELFADLLNARGDADYDHDRRWRRSEVLVHLEQAELLFDQWRQLLDTEQGHRIAVALFLAARARR